MLLINIIDILIINFTTWFAHSDIQDINTEIYILQIVSFMH